MISPPLVIAVSSGYMLLLFVIAAYGDRRAARGETGRATCRDSAYEAG
jgi:hypothetical protein